MTTQLAPRETLRIERLEGRCDELRTELREVRSDLFRLQLNVQSSKWLGLQIIVVLVIWAIAGYAIIT